MQPNSRDECLINKLSTFLQENRSEIINGKRKLSLTSSVLCALNRIFFTFNENNLTAINNSTFEENLNVLINIINNTTALKIVHGTETVQGGIDLSVFQSLLTLELKKFPVHLLVGLHLLHLQLQTLICSRSIASLEELFINEANSEWIALKYLNLSYNYLEKIDSNLASNSNPLMLFPNLETLNVSHNKLKNADGIQFLSKLCAMDLGYNDLEKIPIFNSDAYFQLNELSLRNNSLEDLDGLERIRNLQDLDLSYNCLSEHAVLHPLQNLPYLKILKLDGNPLAYHCQHRNLTVKNLHPNVCTVGIILDEDKLTRTAISKIVKVRDIHESYTRVKIKSDPEEVPILIEEQESPAVICNLPSYNNVSVPTIKGNDTSIATSESFLKDNRIKEDTINSNKENAKELTKTKTKQKKTREAVILDSSTSSRDNYKEEHQQIQIDDTTKEDTKSITSYTEGSAKQLPKTKTKQKKNREVILDSTDLDNNDRKKTFHKIKRESEDSEHIKMKLEARREQFGSEWLISAHSPVFAKSELKIIEDGQNNFISPTDSSLDTNDNEEIPSSNENVQVDRKTSDLSGDGIEILSSAVENINQKDASTELCKKYTCVEENKNMIENVFHKTPGYTEKGFTSLDEDEDAEENIFILEKEDGENQSIIIISIGKQYLKEKDISSADLIDSLDLKVLESVERWGEKTVKLTFNMLKKSRQERIYHMENEMAVEKVLNLLKPHADASRLKNILENTLKCVKCGAQFSKGMAKQEVCEDKSLGSSEYMSSNYNPSEGNFKEINVCPNCGSSIVIEDYSTPVDTPLIQDDNMISDYFLKSQNFPESSSPSTTGLLLDLLQSLKKTSKERNEAKKISSEIDSKDNTIGKRRSNSIDNSRINSSKFMSSMDVLNSMDNISIKSNNSTETASEKQPELREDFRRSSSDITILSNPSQSSITVISGSGSDYSSDFNTFLDEQSLCNTLLNTFLKIENHSTVEGTNISQSYKSNTQETTSSDSEVSSVCTALEHSKPNSPTNSQHTLETDRNSANSSVVDKNSNFMEEKSVSDKSFDLENVERKCEREISASNNNNSDKKEIETTNINLKLDKWSEFDLIEQISVNNFISINHTLKLYLEMQLFDMDEELEAIAQATVITHNTLSEVDGLLALSTKRVHFLELEGDPRDDPEKAVTLFESKDLNQLNTISTLLGNQGVTFIWGTEKQPSLCKYCYTCLFTDADYCNCFLTYFADFMKGRMNSPLQIDTSSEISLKQLTRELFAQNFPSNDSNAEILVFLLIENLTIDRADKDVHPLAVVLTPIDICIAGIAFTQVSTQSKSFQPIEHYMLIDKQKIINIITVHLCTDVLQVGFHFLDEDSNNEFCWLIKTKSKSALFSLLRALKDPWEQQFGIELQLNRITDCKYCT